MEVPGALARVHARYRTPYLSVILFSVITWAIALYGNFAQLVAVSAIARLLFSLSTCLAVPVLRRKMADAPGRFNLPLGAAIPAVAAMASIWLLTGISRTQAIMGGAALILGIAMYFFFRKPEARSQKPESVA